ncbi:MAG: flavin reductase family protein [Thermoanaerobaculia bacterium]
MVDDAQFKLALSHFASGVTVVTTEHEGKRFGMTVASFASLSLRPPLILVCIERGVKSHDAIAAGGRFAVNVLEHAQSEISNRFASRVDDKFAGVETHKGELGVPLLDGALTAIECTVQSQLPGGDHTIFIGEVQHITTREGTPLVYYRSGYHRLA